MALSFRVIRNVVGLLDLYHNYRIVHREWGLQLYIYNRFLFEVEVGAGTTDEYFLVELFG